MERRHSARTSRMRMLLHKCISVGEGQLESQLNEKWKKKLRPVIMTMTVSSCVLTLQKQGDKGAWTVQAAASPSEGARMRQQARAGGFSAGRAQPRRANPREDSTAWWDRACIDSLSPKLMPILGWKWQFCGISSAVSGSAGPASPLFSLI